MWPAKVTKVDGKNVTLEFEYDGKKQTQTLDAKLLQFAWEQRAISKVRTWKDGGGQFQVEAAAVGLDTVKAEVLLHRIDNDQEISVTISRLSAADQDFLSKLATRNENAPAGSGNVARFELLPPPPGLLTADIRGLTMHGREIINSSNRTRGELPADSETVHFADMNKRRFGDSWPEPQDWILDVPRDLANVAPDHGPPAPELTIGTFPLPDGIRAGDLGRLLFAGGPEEWVVTTSYRGKATLVWISLRDGTVVSRPWPSGEALLDVDLANQQVLTASFRDRRVCMTVWVASPKSEKAEPRCTWDSGTRGVPEPGDKSPIGILQSIPARLLSRDRVFQLWNLDHLMCVVWDVGSRKEVWHMTGGIAFGEENNRPCLAVSPNKKYLAVVEGWFCRVLEMESGSTVALISTRGGTTSMAFDADGKQLAILSNKGLSVWKLGSNSPPVTGWRPDQIFRNMHWIDSESILLDGKILYDVRAGMPVWEFAPGERTTDFQFGAGNRVGYLSMGTSAAQTLLCVHELPVKNIRDKVSGEDRIPGSVFHRGVRVRVTKEGAFDDPAIDRLVSRSIENAGWILDPTANLEVKLVGGTEVGKFDARYVYDMKGELHSLVWTYGREQLISAGIETVPGDNLSGWHGAWAAWPLRMMYATQPELFQPILDEWTTMYKNSDFDIQFPQNLSEPASRRDPVPFTGFGKSMYDSSGFSER